MPRQGDRPSGFLKAWQAELPKVAASLTTALILFLASLSFTPVRKWLFQQEVQNYPLTCTADAIAAPDGRRVIEFYVLNRRNKAFSGEELQQELDSALRGSGSTASAGIVLPFRKPGRIERAIEDRNFNQDKGRLSVGWDAGAVRMRVEHIDAVAILRAIIVVAEMDNTVPFTRDVKVAVPFEFQDIQESCYTRT